MGDSALNTTEQSLKKLSLAEPEKLPLTTPPPPQIQPSIHPSSLTVTQPLISQQILPPTVKDAVQAPKTSYLPKWFLDSKAASDDIRRKSVVTGEALKSLGASLQEFTDLVACSKKGDKKNDGRTKSDVSTKTEDERTEDPYIILGTDVFSLILSFTPYPNWFSFAQTSRGGYNFVFNAREDLWGTYYSSRAVNEWEGGEHLEVEPNDDDDDDDDDNDDDDDDDIGNRYMKKRSKLPNEKRMASVQHMKSLNTVINTFSLLKSERARLRSNEITPHDVYSKKDKKVAYPLPLNSQLARNDRKKQGLLMSQINACSKEQRMLILKALQNMSFLTANHRDTISNTTLLSLGATTILSALLDNESGAVKELAANNLANLLATPDDATDELRKNCVASGALKALTALLSSPSATVSMHGGTGGMTNLMRIQNAARVRSIRCQALGNKHGSRALINLLLPNLGVFDKSEIEKRRFKGVGNLPTIKMLDAKVTATKKKKTITVIRRTGYVELEVDGSSDEDESSESLEKDLPFTEFAAYYFYASGTLKDSYNFKIYHHSKEDAFSGKGNDALGPFELEGIIDEQFGERAFSFGKHYLNRGVTNRGLGHVAHIGFFTPGR